MSRILVMAPHADDETLGVGGTIARMADEGHEVFVAVLTGHGEEPHPVFPPESWDKVRAEAAKAHKLLGVRETIYREIPAVMMADQPTYQTNKTIKDIIDQVMPDELYIPFMYDVHRDHREVVSACCVAWRPVSEAGRNIRAIYMYETLSETHWNIQPLEPGFLPNVHVDISGKYLEKKLDALRCFKSQMAEFPHCRSLEGIEALAKLRGSMIGVHAAESFVLVREMR